MNICKITYGCKQGKDLRMSLPITATDPPRAESKSIHKFTNSRINLSVGLYSKQ